METKIEMKWVLKTTDTKKADAMMKTMLKALNEEELNLIDDCKLTKTMYEVNINATEEEEEDGR